MSAVENLKAARAWLGEGEHRWCRGWYWKKANQFGQLIELDRSEGATACCALGAVRDTDRGGWPDEAYWLARALPSPKKSPSAVGSFNDRYSTYADILALYDRAIELAEQAEGGAS